MNGLSYLEWIPEAEVSSEQVIFQVKVITTVQHLFLIEIDLWLQENASTYNWRLSEMSKFAVEMKNRIMFKFLVSLGDFDQTYL